MSDRIPVLICGGGIAGLTAALLLHREGVDAVLVEKHQSTSPYPKARRLNPRSTEIFRRLGLIDAIAAAAAPLARFTSVLSGPTLADAAEPVLSEHMRERFAQGDTIPSLSPGPLLLCPQNLLEPLLAKAAEERGISVRFGTELMSFAQDSDQVTATLRPVDGEPYEVTARYLLAADGARSSIRTALGLPRSGRGHLADNLDVCFRADLTDLVQEKPFNLCQIDNRATSGALVSVNGTDRWVYSTSNSAEVATLPDAAWRDLLRTVIGVPDQDVEILAQMPWESAMYVADRFTAGRVFLTGDAAHVMPPLAAAGANTAIADVANLTWKLAVVLTGRADPALLDTYDTERHPADYEVAERSSQVIGNVGDMLSPVTRGDGMRGDYLTGLFGTQYAEGAFIPDGRDPAPLDHNAPGGRPGTRVPHAWVTADTSTLDTAGPGLSLLRGPEGDSWTASADQLGLKSTTVADPGWLEAVHLPADGALLLRPDAIIAWHSSSGVPLAEAVTEVLGHHRPAGATAGSANRPDPSSH
jgi:putative polyketide hydroxylase